MKSIINILSLTLTLSSFFYVTAYGQDLSKEDRYQEALKLNKEKQFAQSAAELKSLMLENPSIERYKSDYIAVASNANLCKEVLSFATSRYINDAPIYVKDAIFSCAIENLPFIKIDAIAKQMINSQGANASVEEAMIKLSIRNKDEGNALYWSKRYLQDFPESKAAWSERAAVLRLYNRQYEVLALYESLNKQYPNNPDIQKELIGQLLDMGAPQLALDLINQKHWNASQEQKLRALSNSGAVDLRWADSDSPINPDRFLSVDRGIGRLLEALNYSNSIDAPKSQIIAIQSDLIIAYKEKKEWKKSVDLYEDLIENDIAVPSYAWLAAAHSYEELHQYLKAQIIFDKLLEIEPENIEVEYALYYNMVEQDKFDEAQRLLEKLVAQLKIRPAFSPKPNINYSELLIEQAYLEAYQNKYDKAEERINQLLGEIPANTDLLKAAGNIAQWQENYEVSADNYKIAIEQDPSDINAKIGYANARLSSGDIPTFMETVNSLKDGYADMQSVKKAMQRQETYQGAYVTGNFEFGNGTYLGQTNNNRTGDLRAYSETFDDNFRGFARYRGLNSGPAIPADVQGFGGGLQYTGYNQSAEVELGNFGYSRIEGEQIFNDHWSTSASYERNAFYLFPGALYATTAGNVAGLNLNWKNNDTTLAKVGYRYWTLTDNIKQEVFGSVTQRLLTEYNYKLDLTGDIANQQNTNSNVDYFSPINQTEYSGTLSLKVLQWRNIETKKFDFWHRFYGSYGVVTQSGFTPLPMNSYGYGQEFNIGDDQTLSWGIAKTSFPFDGQKTSYITGYLNFEVHFK